MRLEGRASDRVRDLLRPLHTLQRRVLEEVVLGEGPVDADEDVLVDRRRDDEPGPPVGEVRGKVRAPASEGDAQRRAGDQHGRRPYRGRLWEPLTCAAAWP